MGQKWLNKPPCTNCGVTRANAITISSHTYIANYMIPEKSPNDRGEVATTTLGSQHDARLVSTTSTTGLLLYVVAKFSGPAHTRILFP